VTLDPDQESRLEIGQNREETLSLRREGPMSHFVISFMKDVLGDNGRELEVCQSMLEIDAPDEIKATELAKQKFCESQRLCEWSLHADRIQIEPADRPS
jgi:hypothetical protein